MSRWKRFLAVVGAAILAGRASYEVLLRGGGDVHTMLVWSAGLFAGVLVYVVVGLVMALRLDSEEFPPGVSTDPFTAVASLFRPVRGIWQLVRLAIALYAGALTAALTSNALFDLRALHWLGVLAGLITAALGMYWALKPSDS